MSCQILTPGHIKVLKKLSRDYPVIVGLLTASALEGYKPEIVPYKDREYILENLKLNDIKVIPQYSLDPTDNIKKERCTAIASGDGFEQVELDAIEKLNLKRIDIKLDKEVEKQYSSSAIIKKIKSL